MTTNHELFSRAKARIPGGVNSPVRAFRAVGGEPFFTERAEGAYLVDVEGKRYVDYVGSWGPMIAGHAHPAVLDAVMRTARSGLSFGTPNPLEVDMAETLSARVPGCEMVRMVNSGTEATMAAIRLARGATGRERIVKFEGCYHGHGDAFLVKAGSGALTLGVPDSPGVPRGLADLTLTLPYNDLDAARALFAAQGDQIASVIVEPIAGNMNCVLPAPGFLETLRELCTKHGTVLIFDEVMTGFRVDPGGAQRLYGVTPDLTTLGKVMGGGLPVGAFGGRADVMALVAPEGPMYQAGTLSGNPLSMTAGIVTLDRLAAPGVWDAIASAAAELERRLDRALVLAGVPGTVQRVGTMLTLFFTTGPVSDWSTARRSDTARFARFFHALLERGVYWPPSQFEAAFLSAAHDLQTIAATESAVIAALRC